MAEEEFEVKGAHEEALEHELEHRPSSFNQRIALFSAVLATVGAIVSFLGGHTQNEALYYKDEAVLLKAQASDQWSYFQAEKIKAQIDQLAARPASGTLSAKAGSAGHGRSDKISRIQHLAERLDQESEAANQEAENALAPHVKLSIAMTLLQIAIALASIAALTGRNWLLWLAALFALGGGLFGGIAWF